MERMKRQAMEWEKVLKENPIAYKGLESRIYKEL